jgi:hypothetical protein
MLVFWNLKSWYLGFRILPGFADEVSALVLLTPTPETLYKEATI